MSSPQALPFLKPNIHSLTMWTSRGVNNGGRGTFHPEFWMGMPICDIHSRILLKIDRNVKYLGLLYFHEFLVISLQISWRDQHISTNQEVCLTPTDNNSTVVHTVRELLMALHSSPITIPRICKLVRVVCWSWTQLQCAPQAQNLVEDNHDWDALEFCYRFSYPSCTWHHSYSCFVTLHQDPNYVGAFFENLAEKTCWHFTVWCNQWQTVYCVRDR